MGMSHAAGVWIPSVGLDAATVEEVVKGSCKQDGLQFLVFERTEPRATFLVTSLEERDDLHIEIDLLDSVSGALSNRLKVPSYALFAFFGSADWMRVTAFSAKGTERWRSSSDRDADTETLSPVAEKLGLKVWSPDAYDGDGRARVDGITFPYWRMMSEASTPPCSEDLVGLCVKPAFDVGTNDGWKVVHQFEF